VVDPPQSFEDYLDEIDGTTVYRFKTISRSKYERDYQGANFTKSLKSGVIWVIFEDGELPFDQEIERYYNNLADGYSTAVSHASINITYDANSPVLGPRAESFEDLIIESYKDTLITRLGQRYAKDGQDPFVVDDFNVVTKITDNRAVANGNAARVIPGIVMLLAYYCVYSLACDLFASEKDRGFFNKLLLTPVSGRSVVRGKVLTIMTVSGISSIITIFLMFMTSWLNWSNDAMSLLPFGMLLTPVQLIEILAVIMASVYFMSACVVSIIFSLEKLQDIMINLQLPLILFLIDFFLTLFRFSRPLTCEYFLPLHNNICIIRDIYASQAHWYQLAVVIAFDIAGGLLIFKRFYRKADFS
jgi:ABC-type Na+ efflux pump permease subunit